MFYYNGDHSMQTILMCFGDAVVDLNAVVNEINSFNFLAARGSWAAVETQLSVLDRRTAAEFLVHIDRTFADPPVPPET